MPKPKTEDKAIQIVRDEKTAFENAEANITPRISFNIYDLLQTCIKNYYGVFDDPVDPVTGRDKVWAPVSETVAETCADNWDLDTKDATQIHSRFGRNPALARLVKAKLIRTFHDINFGERLDEAIRYLAIFGTVVWSVEEINKKPDLRIVSLFNFYIDPTAPSISEADRVTERFIMPASAFQKLAKSKGWQNADGPKGRKNIPRYEDGGTTANTPTSNDVEIFRTRGLIPKFILTKNEKDEVMVPGEIICSKDGGTWYFHNASERKDNKNKGYEECWATRVPQRWYGRGPVEKSIPLQVWYNIVQNVRITRQTVNQLGLFKVKSTSGITAQSLSRLAVNGAVKVNNMDDIEQFVLQDVPQSSYMDEKVIWDWVQKVTKARDISAGDNLPASTPATNAAIMNQNSQTSFAKTKEGIAMWLERVIYNQLLPIEFKNMKAGDIVRLVGEEEEIKLLDEFRVNAQLMPQIQAANQMLAAGDPTGTLDPMQVEMERQRGMSQLQAYGKERFIEMLHSMNLEDYDVELDITNEKTDVGIMSQRIVEVLAAAPEQRQTLIPILFDLLGIPYTAPKPTMMPQDMNAMMGQFGQMANPIAPRQTTPGQPQQTGANIPRRTTI